VARPRVHLAASIALGIAQYARTRRLLPALAPLATGVLIDADHLIDHWLYNRFPAGARERLVLPLHGWEYLPLIAWAEPKLLGPLTARGLLIGYLAHILIDVATNKVASPRTYSLISRALRGFRGKVFRDDFDPTNDAHAWRDAPLWKIWRWL
jgi:hypothetical protein